jgi:hypothetical protein
MAALLRQMVATLIGAVFLYGVLAMVSLTIVRPVDVPNLDLGGNPCDTMLFGLASLTKGERAVVLLGASNLSDWPLAAMDASLGAGTHVHNLYVGASNISDTDSLTQVIRDRLPPERRARTVLVLGMWYGLFADNYSRYANLGNSVDQLRLKYKILYAKRDGKVVRVLPPSLFDVVSIALLPVRAISQLRYPPSPAFHVAAELPARSEAEMVRQFQARVDRTKATLMGNKDDGAILPEQFEVMVSMVRQLSDDGFKVVLLDMPLAPWHAAHSPFQATYNSTKGPYLAALGNLPNVAYIDMQSAGENAYFSDGVHLYPQYGDMLAGMVADRLAAVLRAWGQ